MNPRPKNLHPQYYMLSRVFTFAIQLRPQDTAMFDGLGLQPGPITVTAKGLTVAFVGKPP